MAKVCEKHICHCAECAAVDPEVKDCKDKREEVPGG